MSDESCLKGVAKKMMAITLSLTKTNKSNLEAIKIPVPQEIQ